MGPEFHPSPSGTPIQERKKLPPSNDRSPHLKSKVMNSIIMELKTIKTFTDFYITVITG
jgi:hypothetical protein